MRVAFCLFALLASAGRPTRVTADVVVLANRTTSAVTWQVVDGSAVAGQRRLEAGALVPVPTSGKLAIEVLTGRPPRPTVYRLDADSSYYFGQTRAGPIQLGRIGLGGDSASARGRGLGSDDRLGTLPVKILVDDDEPARQSVWEPRLRRRLALASAVLERHCRLRLRVVATGTWTSDDSVQDFGGTLAEFERAVRPSPARVAIGFTSQYKIPGGRMHLGGTRGPLHSHILIREWSQHIPEPQRVELLLHELGHYLGAAHSPEPDSIMRPVLIDRTTRNKRFPIQFDPVNTLLIYIVGEEIRYRHVWQFAKFGNPTKRRLWQIYGELDRAAPRDPVARNYARRLQFRQPERR